jgi:hypothetical protein
MKRTAYIEKAVYMTRASRLYYRIEFFFSQKDPFSKMHFVSCAQTRTTPAMSCVITYFYIEIIRKDRRMNVRRGCLIKSNLGQSHTNAHGTAGGRSGCNRRLQQEANVKTRGTNELISADNLNLQSCSCIFYGLKVDRQHTEF